MRTELEERWSCGSSKPEASILSIEVSGFGSRADRSYDILLRIDQRGFRP